MDFFVSSIKEGQELARPADYDYLDLLQITILFT